MRTQVGALAPLGPVPSAMVDAVSEALSSGSAGQELAKINTQLAEHNELAVLTRRTELEHQLSEMRPTLDSAESRAVYRSKVRDLRKQIANLDVQALDAQSARYAGQRRVREVQDNAVLGKYTEPRPGPVAPQEFFDEFRPEIRGTLANSQAQSHAQYSMLDRQSRSYARIKSLTMVHVEN